MSGSMLEHDGASFTCGGFCYVSTVLPSTCAMHARMMPGTFWCFLVVVPVLRTVSTRVVGGTSAAGVIYY